MIAESWAGRDLDRAMRGDFDKRVDDVLFPITFAGGHIAGQRVAGQGSDRDVVGAANPAFEHAATPGRNFAREAKGLNLARAGMPADATQLDVNDPRGTELDGGFRVAEVPNRLVEANRSF